MQASQRLAPGHGRRLPGRQRGANAAFGMLALQFTIALGLTLATFSAARAQFLVEAASTHVDNDVVMLDARVDFSFSDAAREAMANAIPLTVALQVEVLRIGTVFDRDIAEVSLRYRVQTHPLSQRYVVTQLNSGDARTYRSYESMRRALGEIEDVPILDTYLLEQDARHVVRLRAALEVEELPAPMRPLAYIRSQWKLNSDWAELPLEP